MPLQDVLHRVLANQLGGPSGLLGSLVANRLNKRNAPAISAAVDALELNGNGTVADIGFGGGFGLDLLLAATNGGTVHGVEPAADMIKRARRVHAANIAGGRLELHEASMQSLPLESQLLDGWISLNTIYFMDELAAGFAELRRVLEPAGVGVLGVADPEWMARQPFTKHRFTVRPVDEVVTALERVGFAVEKRQVRRGEGTGGDAPYNLLLCRAATA